MTTSPSHPPRLGPPRGSLPDRPVAAAGGEPPTAVLDDFVVDWQLEKTMGEHR